ncbi:unnamed protein product [Cunninghamella blakesleeana]
MVSFQCEGCGDIIKKPKCKQHQQRCHSPFTCIDCHETFPGNSFQPHNQCITENEKYQKGYKPPTNKRKQNTNSDFTTNGTIIQNSKVSSQSQPVSIIEQLKQKQSGDNKRLIHDDEQLSNSNKKQKKTKKEKKEKKIKLSEWSVEELDTNVDRQIKLALEFILKKEKNTCSIETLRDNVVSLIVSHPKASEPATVYNSRFDQLVGLSFNSKKGRITFSYLKSQLK